MLHKPETFPSTHWLCGHPVGPRALALQTWGRGWRGAAAPGCQRERTCAMQEAPSPTGPVPIRQTAAVTIVLLRFPCQGLALKDPSHTRDHKLPRRGTCFVNEADQTLVADKEDLKSPRECHRDSGEGRVSLGNAQRFAEFSRNLEASKGCC